jgi:hypothetical protein
LGRSPTLSRTPRRKFVSYVNSLFQPFFVRQAILDNERRHAVGTLFLLSRSGCSKKARSSYLLEYSIVIRTPVLLPLFRNKLAPLHRKLNKPFDPPSVFAEITQLFADRGGPPT